MFDCRFQCLSRPERVMHALISHFHQYPNDLSNYSKKKKVSMQGIELVETLYFKIERKRHESYNIT